MSGSIKLLTVGGIDIRVHITFPLILVWAAIQFGILSDGGVVGGLFGIIVTTLLFVIVTLHELGHSLAARSYDVPVEQIVLLPLGGVAQLKEMPEKPVQELVIAIAGPAVNFILAALFWAIVIALDVQLASPTDILRGLQSITAEAVFGYLFFTNIFLAVFNLLPAFPMDGGRVLRALLATRLPYLRATSVAVRVGRTFAWVLGLYGFLGGGFFVILIAFFIYTGAGQELAMVRGRSILRGLRVAQAFSRDVQTLSSRDTLQDAVNLTLSSLQASFPVCDGEQLVGILSYPALVRGLNDHGPNMLVSHVMSKNVPAVRPTDELLDVQEFFREGKIEALPVVEGSQFLGMITSKDVGEVFRLVSVDPDLLPRAESL